MSKSLFNILLALNLIIIGALTTYLTITAFIKDGGGLTATHIFILITWITFTLALILHEDIIKHIRGIKCIKNAKTKS